MEVFKKDDSSKLNSQAQLEDLLKVKQFERPESIFWESFDQELKEKMLQASLKEPYWKRIGSRIFDGALYGAPVGVAAMLILALVWHFTPSALLSPQYPNYSQAIVVAEDLDDMKQYPDALYSGKQTFSDPVLKTSHSKQAHLVASIMDPVNLDTVQCLASRLPEARFSGKTGFIF